LTGSKVIAARRLRLGMVGGGRGALIGAVHRMAARLDDRYTLVCGALSSDAERARESGADLLLDPDRIYTTVDDMIAGERTRDDPMDVVAIVTPNHLHYAAARRCLEAGFHVICDKPLTTSVEEAEALCAAAEDTGRLLAVTYNYSGYPLVRSAREMVRAGELGSIHRLQVEYLQDWLLQPLEATGHKQASWRTDPALGGPGGCVADIGSHAFHLAEFISGLRVVRLAAELTTLVPDRRVDDSAQVSVSFDNGARGALWASQVATGHENDLEIRVYGDRASLTWRQESPNQLVLTPFGEPSRTITRSTPAAGSQAAHASRIPPGHPEGFIEAFAQIYRDVAERIVAAANGVPPSPESLLAPDGRDGLRGVRFVHAAVESSRRGMQWMDL
jgi:predicted dehydrogenase